MYENFKTSFLPAAKDIEDYLKGRKVFYESVINALDRFNKFRGVFENHTSYMEGL